MSRYRSVPVSATARPGASRAAARYCAQAAIESAERRACKASMASGAQDSTPGDQWRTTWTSNVAANMRCQRCAVVQLPLLASRSAGLTITILAFFTDRLLYE